MSETGGANQPEPLVPGDVDLDGFDYMPFEFSRLFQSETWILSNDAEKVAAISLWGKSWSEVPAGSLPNDDRMLAHLSGAAKGWRKVKPMALRGWVLASDNRLYHPTVCERALEAWIARLTKRLSSGAGNAAKYSYEFDATPIITAIEAARTLLFNLNPESRILAKSIPKRVPSGDKKAPNGSESGIPPGLPPGSQEKEKGKGKEDQEHLNPNGLSVGDGSPPLPDDPAAGGQGDLVGGVAGKPKRPEIPECPHLAIVELFHEKFPAALQVRQWTGKRAEALRARWREDAKRQDVAWWSALFDYIAKSDFLMGKVAPTAGHKQFRLSLEFIVTHSSFVKIIEGTYHDGH